MSKNEHELEWGQLLKNPPRTKQGFSNELMYGIIEALNKTNSKRKIYSSYKLWASVVLTAVTIAALIFYLPSKIFHTTVRSGATLTSNESRIQQVQSKVPFQLLLPTELPHNMSYQNALVTTNPNDNKVSEVSLNFASTDNKWTLVVQESKGSSLVGFTDGMTKDVTINGLKGKYHTDSKQVAITWTNGKVICMAYTSPSTDFSSEQSMISLASKFTSSSN